MFDPQIWELKHQKVFCKTVCCDVISKDLRREQVEILIKWKPQRKLHHFPSYILLCNSVVT